MKGICKSLRHSLNLFSFRSKPLAGLYTDLSPLNARSRKTLVLTATLYQAQSCTKRAEAPEGISVRPKLSLEREVLPFKITSDTTSSSPEVLGGHGVLVMWM